MKPWIVGRATDSDRQPVRERGTGRLLGYVCPRFLAWSASTANREQLGSFSYQADAAERVALAAGVSLEQQGELFGEGS
jgi:hypothetical protein